MCIRDSIETILQSVETRASHVRKYLQGHWNAADEEEVEEQQEARGRPRDWHWNPLQKVLKDM
eukprot:1918115-Prorocentrum_lima.AAC.1